MILKGEKIKLLEEEVFQVPKQVGRILSFQEIYGIAGILEIEVRSDDAFSFKTLGPCHFIEIYGNTQKTHLKP